MKNTRTMLMASAGAALALVVQPAPAFAEDSGDIIVTARKREESILKVPVVQNVLTNESLETYQVNNLQDITTRIPGLVSGNAVLAIGEQMSLRGVGSNSLDQGVDQSVSLNIDGLQLSHGLAYKAASFDLAQVEVLKGPQALYFGKNSTAGVISFRTADPGDTLEIKAKAGYEFESREKRGELIFSAPISDTVGIRIAGLYSDSKGIFKNKATAVNDSSWTTNLGLPPNLGGKDPRYKRVGGGESWLTRFTLLWKPDETFTARLKVNLARDNYRQGGLTELATCPDGKVGVPSLYFPYYHPDEDCKYDDTFYMVDLDPAAFPGVKNHGTPFLDLKQDFGSLELNYEASPELTVTSVTGYYKSYAETMINGTSTGYAGPAISAENDFRRREFTQELRVNSDFSSQFNFTLGAFFQDGKVSNAFKLGGNTAQFLPPVLIQGVSTFDITTYSLFGQGRFQASPQFEIAAGVRWAQEKRDLEVSRFGAPVVLAPGSDRLNSKNWSPELTLTYTPTDDFTVFGALKQAYKSGSFNIVIPGAAGEDKSFGDEKVRGGELGIKSRLMNRQLSFDLAGYYYRYSGLQTGVNEPAQNGLPVLRTVNAGKAEVYGVDVEAHYRPDSIDGLTLNLALAWNKTKFLELNNVPCYGGQLISQGCTEFWTPVADQTTPGLVADPSGQSALLGKFTGQNLKGVPFVRAPEWIINFGFDYEMPVGDDMRLVIANDNRYASSYLVLLGDPKVRPDTVEKKALTIDASITLHGPNDRWTIAVFGKNLTNKLRPGYGSSFNYAGASVFNAPIAGTTVRNAAGEDEQGRSLAAGRAIGITLGYKFSGN